MVQLYIGKGSYVSLSPWVKNPEKLEYYWNRNRGWTRTDTNGICGNIIMAVSS